MDIKVIILKYFFIIGCVFTVTSAAEETNHETEFELLKAQIQVLQSKINYLEKNARDIRDLQQSVRKLENEKDSTSLYFDCYRTEDLSNDGTITFNGCSVDTTTIDPWRGMFTIQTPGIYRLTFMGRVSMLNGDGSVEVDLLVDGELVASARDYEYWDWDMISINTIQELRSGQNISITWSGKDGAFLQGGSYTSHFTGEYLSTSAWLTARSS